ncbi:major tail protein [Alkalicoccobacillus plakortidis]|uniref:Phage tail protein n=1 Tax=Alkalicoccobacillus plakortidis TaxID=444060 RepID=A0ABT0XI67_9BACI|nr:major tail protein [Alkalicoccobacillus plakortidis]MCM2675579.1 phage tail protein [Alkalicoccobacillus plakortidis]
MPEEQKNYTASTGVDEFYYGVLADSGTAIMLAGEDIEKVEFPQTIGIEMPQEIVKAYGGNKIAEMAVSAGDTTVTSAFHKIPTEDKKKLLGLEAKNGITAMGAEDNPPYVAVIFAKTYQSGRKEWVACLKGIFTRPNINAQTKGESVEFNPEEINAQFMDRELEGFDKLKSVATAEDAAGETKNRDALFMATFGKPFPGTTPPAGGVEG